MRSRTLQRADANPARCPDCGADREHPGAICDVCAYDPDRFVSEADTTWDDGSPATRLLMAETDHDAGNEVPAPPADLLTVERPAASRWWGWLLSLAVVLSWLLRGCR